MFSHVVVNSWHFIFQRQVSVSDGEASVLTMTETTIIPGKIVYLLSNSSASLEHSMNGVY